MDIKEHGSDASRALRQTRDWLANVSRRELPSANRIAALFDKFRDDLIKICADLDFDPKTIPYVDHERILVNWLIEAKAA